MTLSYSFDKYVLRYADISPEKIAIEREDKELTYAGLKNQVIKLSELLKNEGLSNADFVVIKFNDEIKIVVTVLALSRIGVPFLVARRSFSPTFLSANLAVLKPSVFLSDSSHEILHNTRKILIQGDVFSHPIDSEWKKNSDAEQPEILYLNIGSGSTGKPKIFAVNHQEEIENLITRSHAYKLSEADVVSTLSSLDFTTARRHIFSALSAGARILLTHRDSLNRLDLIGYSNISVLHAPVLGLHQLLQKFRNNKQVFKDLRLLGSGGSNVHQSLRQEIDQHLTPHLHVVYGANEIGFISIAGPSDWKISPSSVGRLLPNIEARFVNKSGEDVAQNQPGIILLRKKNMFQGYIGNPELNKKHFNDSWFVTYDIGKVTPEGHIELLGRADDLMIFNGVNIYPAEIETEVRKIPEIKDVAAIPFHHPVHSDVPVCAVQVAPNSRITPEEIVQIVQPTLGLATPRLVVLLEEIPRNELGKLDRAKLYSMIQTHTAK